MGDKREIVRIRETGRPLGSLRSGRAWRALLCFPWEGGVISVISDVLLGLKRFWGLKAESLQQGGQGAGRLRAPAVLPGL